MDNNLSSLQDIFKTSLFRIPDYQRGYSWTNDELTAFWEDVINLPNDKDHYTGMISLRQLGDEETKSWNDENWLLHGSWCYKAFHVVDGQQRLTTIIILINEIIKYYRNLPKNKDMDETQILIDGMPLATIREEYLCKVKPDSFGQLKTYKFGYETDNPSYEFFKSRVLEETEISSLEETFYTLNLENAKQFFAYKLKKTHEDYGLKEIEALYTKLTQHLKFNIYYIDSDFNVYIAFETMNNRGKKLSNLELLKNRLIYLTTLFNVEEDVKESVRGKINSAWKTVYSYLGKNKEKALNDDKYLQAHWIIYYGYTRKTKNDYSVFLLKEQFTQKRILEKVNENSIIEHIEEPEEETDEDIEIEEPEEQEVTKVKKKKLSLDDIGNYVDSLKALIPYWYIVHFPEKSELDEELKTWLDRINRLGFGCFEPLTAVVLSKKNIKKSEKLAYLQAVERFIFLELRLIGYTTSYKNSAFYKLTFELYHDKITIDTVLKELAKLDGISRDNVIDMSVAMNYIKRQFRNAKGYYSWSGIKYFLYEYETYIAHENEAPQTLYPKDIFKKDEKDKISIEHIYPQTPTDEYWINNFAKYDKTQRKILNGTLGNILPLSLAINKALQNIPFSKKKERYKKGSHSEVEVSWYEDWTPDTILERGLKMLDFMADRWDFKFRNEDDKLRLLNLEFMSEEPLEEIEPLADETPRKKHQKSSEDRTYNVITMEMIEESYRLAKEIYANHLSAEDAISTLKAIGMKSSTANIHIKCFNHMMNGELYRRAISKTAVDYFVSNIAKDFGADFEKKAIESVRQNYNYISKIGYQPTWQKSWLESHGINVD